MSGADAMRAIRAGFNPHANPAGFARYMQLATRSKNLEISSLRARDLTRRRGYSLNRRWLQPQEMLREAGLSWPPQAFTPTCIEEWVRAGSNPIFIGKNDDNLVVLSLRPSGRWIRLE